MPRGFQLSLLMGRMEARSTLLASLCDRARGEEMSKSGLLWLCPSCLAPNTPGRKKKGGGYEGKPCSRCGHALEPGKVSVANLVENKKPQGRSATFIDGDDLNRRYLKVRPRKWIRLGVSGWDYKPADIYSPPKILVRQAGVGLAATLDETESRCPQSVYLYRLKHECAALGYRHEYVLAALLSRTMAYYVFKRFAEVDPAKAHAKLTHERLSGLPIPTVDFSDRAQRESHERIVASARRLLDATVELGGEDDREIEQALRDLWGIDSSEGAYVNGEFCDLPESQAIRDLFPQGVPKPVRTAGDAADGQSL